MLLYLYIFVYTYTNTGFPIRLEGFLYTYSAQSTYEPELFPGLVYRMADPKVSRLCVYVYVCVCVVYARVYVIICCVYGVWGANDCIVLS